MAPASNDFVLFWNFERFYLNLNDIYKPLHIGRQQKVSSNQPASVESDA